MWGNATLYSSRRVKQCGRTISSHQLSQSQLCSSARLKVLLTLRTAGLKLWANFRRELRSCWKPWSSKGDAWWTPEGQLLPGCLAPCCCRRHTLVLITSRRSHNSSWTTYKKINIRKYVISIINAQYLYLNTTLYRLGNLIQGMNLPFEDCTIFSSSLCKFCCTWSSSGLQCRYIALLCDTHAMQLQCTPALTQAAVHLLAPPPEEKASTEASVPTCWDIPREEFSCIYLFTCIVTAAAFPSEEIYTVVTLTCTLHGLVPVCDWWRTLSKLELWQCGPRLRLSRSRALALSL